MKWHSGGRTVFFPPGSSEAVKITLRATPRKLFAHREWRFFPAPTPPRFDHTVRFYPTIQRVDTPVIAVVQGYTLGRGANLAVSCDLVAATDNTLFGYPEVRLGIAAARASPNPTARWRATPGRCGTSPPHSGSRNSRWRKPRSWSGCAWR